jgi:hypothetical protein
MPLLQLRGESVSGKYECTYVIKVKHNIILMPYFISSAKVSNLLTLFRKILTVSTKIFTSRNAQNNGIKIKI